MLGPCLWDLSKHDLKQVPEGAYRNLNPEGRFKNFMKFQTGVSKFQFKVSFSSSKFSIRVLKLGAHLNRFDYNEVLISRESFF